MVALREAKIAMADKASMKISTTTRATPDCLGDTNVIFMVVVMVYGTLSNWL
jgi:hypothetical protein